jgi:hypothetical protein
MADNEQVFRIVVDYKTAYEELERVKEKLKAAQSETRNLTIKQQELNEQFKQGVISEQEYQSASEALRQKLIANRKEVTALTEERRKAMQIEKSMALAEMAEANSLIQLRETLKTLTKQFDALGEAKQKSAKGVQLQKEIDGLNKKILELEMSTGRFGRNVGNYASGFNPLNFQVQQLTRELPSLTMSLQQFFLAISNNLPMFADELQRAAAANEKLRKEGHATIPVWRQVLSALGSWQTILVVGITLLTAYGKEIGQWVKELFRGEKAFNVTAEAQKRFNEAMVQGQVDAQKEIVELNLLYHATQNTALSIDTRRNAVEKLQNLYPTYFGQIETEKILNGEASGTYQQLARDILTVAQVTATRTTMMENAQQRQKIVMTEGFSEMNTYTKMLESLPKVNILQSGYDLRKEISNNLDLLAKDYPQLASLVRKEIGLFEGSGVAIIDMASRYNARIDQISILNDKATQKFKNSNKELYEELEGKGLNPVQAVDALTEADNKLIDFVENNLNKLPAVAKTAAQREADFISMMAEGREKDLRDQKLQYEEKLKAYNDDAQARQEIEAWNNRRISEINAGWDKKANEAAKKSAKKAADQRKQIEDDTIKYMREGREKDLTKQEQEYRNDLEKYNGNSEKLQELEEWNRNQILEINEKWDEKEIRHGLDTQKFRVSLMEDGTAKQLALLEIEHAEKLMKAKKNGTDLLEIDKWYKKEQEKILAASPHGERIKADAQAAANYHKEIARIESLKIKEKEKDYLKAKAENDLEKTKILNHKAEIDRLYSLGKITVDEYNKMSAEIGVDLANNENKGNELEDPKNPKLKKVGSFFARLFGYDPDDKDDRKEFKQKRKELIDQAADTAREIGQAVIDIQTEISQRRLKLEQERIDAERDSELKSLELRYNKGLMSEKAYNKAVEATNAEADRKKEEAERAAFEREKRLKIMGIAIDTAAGITKVWSETGLTGWKLAMAIAQTAFLTANGIAQTAVISNQQFAQGGIVPIGDGKNGVSMGMLQGPSHSQGGIPLMVNGQPVNAEVEGGEILAVINKRSAAQYLPLFSAINATNGVKFENGGVVGSGWSLPTPAPLPPSNGQMLASMRDDLRTYYRQTERMIKATTERIDNIKVYVSEKDITKVQKNVARIKAMATIIGGK